MKIEIFYLLFVASISVFLINNVDLNARLNNTANIASSSSDISTSTKPRITDATDPEVFDKAFDQALEEYAKSKENGATRQVVSNTPKNSGGVVSNNNATGDVYIKNDITNYIREQAKINNINVNKALAVAWCESRFDPNASNGHSTAKGVYQFLRGTWANYCEGDVFDYKSNIDCFMKIYPKHPSWWECHWMT